MEEQELASRCSRGDSPAQRELYERYAGRLLSVCLRYIPEREVAEDLLHDAFIRIFSSFSKFSYRGEGSLRAWMERIMVNEALLYLRKQDVLSQAVELDGLPPGSMQPYDEPDEETVERIPEEVLMQMIAELPAGYRMVFNLYVFEGKSHREIARLLDINEKSSSSQLARAKAQLARRVREWEEANG